MSYKENNVDLDTSVMQDPKECRLDRIEQKLDRLLDFFDSIKKDREVESDG